MKNLITLIFLAVGSYNTPGFAQAKSQELVITEPSQPSVYKNLLYKESVSVYKRIDTYPVYTGGFSALQDFLRKNLKADGETGRVIATFVIEKDGAVSNIEVVRSFSDKAKAEALRVIKLMPKWKPGIDKGRIVRVQFTIPISFPTL
ncbi:MAG: TonB family protein [Mucilaginibacter sp.]|nr:TonB family protein [Mucilaginibacter sp.]